MTPLDQLKDKNLEQIGGKECWDTNPAGRFVLTKDLEHLKIVNGLDCFSRQD